MIVGESASDGEDGFEHGCEESNDALEDQTEACDQQSKKNSKCSRNGSLALMGEKKMQGQLH